MTEETAGIHLRSVADIAAFGIGDDEMVGIMLAKVGYRLLEGIQTGIAQLLVKGQVGLVCHTVGSGGVDDSAVERIDGIFFCQ